MSEPKEMTTSELSLAIEQGKTLFAWVSYAGEDDDEDGLWIELALAQARTVIDRAAEEWDTIPVWDRDESLYIGLGPEPE